MTTAPRYHGLLSLILAFTALLAGPGLLHASETGTNTSADQTLTVYKSPTCGCCEQWVEHLQAKGFSTRIEHPADLNGEKSRRGIAPRYQSCHTAVTADGFVFEGHVPAPLIARFLAEKPEGAIGLAVPGMPVGSPGMEMDTRFDPYDVLLLMKDGSSSVYTRIDAMAQQY